MPGAVDGSAPGRGSSSEIRMRPQFCKKGIHTTHGATPLPTRAIGPNKVIVTRARCVCGQVFITGRLA